MGVILFINSELILTAESKLYSEHVKKKLEAIIKRIGWYVFSFYKFYIYFLTFARSK